MSFDGSVYFFVLYHYESNAILATPITGLNDVSIFNAYKTYFDVVTTKGFKPKLNIMDNQATKHIKNFLTENDCKLQVVEPHYHRVNAAEWAIQTFKAHSLLLSRQLIVISHCNCGIVLLHRSRTFSTCYALHA